MELDEKKSFHSLDIETTNEEDIFPEPPLNLTSFHSGSNRTEIQEESTTVPSERPLVTAENDQEELNKDGDVDVLKFENDAFAVEYNVNAKDLENKTFDDAWQVPNDSTENRFHAEEIDVHDVAVQSFPTNSQNNEAFDLSEDVAVDPSKS